MVISEIEHASQRPKALRKARAVTMRPDWQTSGARDMKEQLVAPKYGAARASTRRCNCLQHVEDLDPEHPLRGPHPTD